jgi:hypothetical protein
VSDDLSHLTPAAAELLQAPQDARIRAILGERWVLPRDNQDASLTQIVAQ